MRKTGENGGAREARCCVLMTDCGGSSEAATSSPLRERDSNHSALTMHTAPHHRTEPFILLCVTTRGGAATEALTVPR